MRGVIGIVRDGERFLVIQRAATVRAPLKWCFPGGEIEDGESEEDALARELREELNLTVRGLRQMAVREKHDGRLLLYCWAAQIVAGRPTPNPAEVAQCQWVTLDELRGWDELLPGTIEIAEMADLA